MYLFLDSLGTSLKIANGMLEIKKAADSDVQCFVPEQVDAIFISKGVSFSSDVVMLCVELQIDVVLVDRLGNAKGRFWGNKFGSIASIRKNQLVFANHQEGRIWARQNIIQKIQTQLAWLYQIKYSDYYTHTNLLRAEDNIGQIEKIQAKVSLANVEKEDWTKKLRGLEGSASRIYLQMLALALPSGYYFKERTRPAQDMFNAALNYLYGILYARVENALIKAGVDPALGIFHADEYNKPVLVYDFIEPYRVWADMIVFRLCQEYALKQDDFINHKEGIWLNGNTKKIVISRFIDFMENEVINHKGRQRSRFTHITLDAQEFAQILLKFKPE